ncbi:MAG: hypothetical protein HYZ24_06090 [Chloroflexi bacterium]|nr:hypothetical protein [Chloroflexota bacterium]
MDNGKGGPDESQAWLKSLGFRFDPFEHLNAADDPHLGEYVVDLDKYLSVWEDCPTLVFAPPGGGKTTLRVYTYRSLWVGRDGLHPFPVQCYLPFATVHENWGETFERDFGRALAYALLLSLSCRPERFTNMTADARRALTNFFYAQLGGELQNRLAVLEQEHAPSVLAEQIDRAYLLPDSPTVESVKLFCAEIRACLPQATAHKTGIDTLDDFINLVVRDLNFQSLHVLIDGADGESNYDPQAAAKQVNRLLEKAARWQEQGIYLKLFLPLEMEEFVASNWHRIHIEWTPALLAKVIEQRVYVASGGNFNSLSGAGGIGLRNVPIEQELAEAVAPLPREIIFIAHRLFEAYKNRSQGAGKLEPEDLNAALKEYRADNEQRHISPAAVSAF